MPLSKKKQADWMREYRANKKILGITTNKSRGIGISVIPKLVDRELPSERYWVDADGNQIYDD